VTSKSSFPGHLAVVLVCLAITIAWVFLILSQSDTVRIGRSGYDVNVVVPTSAQLSEGARVTVGGADVGNVAKVERSTTQRGTRLLLAITDRRVTPIPVDSRVQIRTRTPVGENYVSIAVGHSAKTLLSGAYLASRQADELVEVDQILSVLDGRTKERARKLLAGLGGGLEGRGTDLNATLGEVAGTVEHGGTLVGVLYRDRAIASKLVDQLGQVAAAVGERGAAIDTIAQRGLVSLRAMGDRDTALAATLRALPPALAQIRRTAGTVGTVTAKAAPVVDNLTIATRDLRPAVRALAPAARDGRAILASLGAAAPRLRGTLASLSALSKPLPGALPEIRRTLCQINPVLRYLEPYKADLLRVMVGLGSASDSYDATGHLIRLAPVLNDNSISGAPPQVNAAATTLLNSGLFLESKRINYDPYMKPGLIGTTAAQSGQPSGPEQLAKSGYKYPRVKRDC
jgi:phospholipid/cholesterol/gamma-HCH transport system substrate-binding protein